MLAPEQDETDRRPIWDRLQMFWMDTDPDIFLESVAKTCAQSKYSLSEIEQIFCNEVRPAVEFNLLDSRRMDRILSGLVSGASPVISTANRSMRSKERFRSHPSS